MTSRIKLPFKLGDSKKINELEVNETSKKDDFSLSEVRNNFSSIRRNSFYSILDCTLWFSISTNNTCLWSCTKTSCYWDKKWYN